MKLVVDIPEEAYKTLLKEQRIPTELDYEYLIMHGMPLPKGHGDLIYRNDVIKDLRDSKKWFRRKKHFIKGEATMESMAYEIDDIKYVLKNVQTVIEADKE